jgi:hypothetical protein
MDVMQPLREFATPLADISQPMPFTAVQSAFDAFFPRGVLRNYWKSVYLTELSDEVIDLIALKGSDRPSPLSIIDTYVHGGAIGRVAPEDSAFGDRSAPYMVAIMGIWEDPADDERTIAWVRATWSEIARFGSGTYLNFAGLSDEESSAGVAEAFGPKLERLAEIKSKYDPDNFLRRNNNVEPAN